MNPAFQRRTVVLSTGPARHPSVEAALSRLLAEGFQVAVAGPGAPLLARDWVVRGWPVQVGIPGTFNPPSIALMGDAQDETWAAGSPHRLAFSPSLVGLAGVRLIGNLEEWVDAYLAPRVPRLKDF